jgi:hypothetical protein
VPKAPKKSDVFGKIGFLKRYKLCFIRLSTSSVVLPLTGTSTLFDKSDFSNRAQGAQEIRFLGKIGFIKRYKLCFIRLSTSSVVLPLTGTSTLFDKSDFSNRAQGAQEIRCFWKNRISQALISYALSVYPRHPLYFQSPARVHFLKNQISQTFGAHSSLYTSTTDTRNKRMF